MWESLGTTTRAGAATARFKDEIKRTHDAPDQIRGIHGVEAGAEEAEPSAGVVGLVGAADSCVRSGRVGIVEKGREEDLLKADEERGDSEPEVEMGDLHVTFEMAARVEETEGQLDRDFFKLVYRTA